MRRTTSLSTRMVATAIAAALVVGVVSALLAVPLVRNVVGEQARVELSRSVEALAASPRISTQLIVRERRAVGPDDRRYALVSPDGTITGEAVEIIGAAVLDELARDGSVSTTVRIDGTDFLLEGRTIRSGTLGRQGAHVVAVQPQRDVDEATGRLLRRLVIALVVGLAVAGGAGLLMSRRTARPVHEAAARARRLAAGERGLSATWSPVTEVEDMSRALTALDAALAGSEARQREFLLSISHELRTPLTALLGYAEALRDGAVAPDDVARVGATLSTETERLDRFIADLLALARLEADDFRLVDGPVQLDTLIARTVDAWQALAIGANVALTSTAPPTPTTFTGDAERVRQLLDGLVENALRATPDGGEVRIDGSVQEGAILLRVTDSGPGLAAGDHERAFERGYLRDRYAAHRSVGTGLGLSIAHRLAERMGASLVALPEAGAGTTLLLTLPAGPGIILR